MISLDAVFTSLVNLNGVADNTVLLQGSIMAALNQPFDMFAGEYKQIIYTVKDASKALLDLTGCTFTWVFSTKSGNVMFFKPGVLLDQVTAKGQFTIILNPSDTNILFASVYMYQVVMTDASSHPGMIAYGDVKVKANTVLEIG